MRGEPNVEIIDEVQYRSAGADENRASPAHPPLPKPRATQTDVPRGVSFAEDVRA